MPDDLSHFGIGDTNHLDDLLFRVALLMQITDSLFEIECHFPAWHVDPLLDSIKLPMRLDPERP